MWPLSRREGILHHLKKRLRNDDRRPSFEPSALLGNPFERGGGSEDGDVAERLEHEEVCVA